MAKCVVHTYAAYPHVMFGGSGEARCRCTTHSWDFGFAPVTATTQCPMGRIEEKVEEVMAKLDAIQAKIS